MGNWQYPDRDPHNGDVECRWAKQPKIAIFDHYLALASMTAGQSRVVNISAAELVYST